MPLVAFKFTVERLEGVPYRIFRGLLGCPALECKLVGEAIPQGPSRNIFKVTVQGTKRNIRRYRDVLICIEPVMGSFNDISFTQFHKGDEEDQDYRDFEIVDDVPDTEGMVAKSPTKELDKSESESVAETQSLGLDTDDVGCSEPVAKVLRKSPAKALAGRVNETSDESESESVAETQSLGLDTDNVGDSEPVTQVIRRRPAKALGESAEAMSLLSEPGAGASEDVDEEPEKDSQEMDDWEMVMSQSILSRRGNW